MSNIRIFIIEDNRLLRDSIVSMLKKQPDMRIVAADGEDDNLFEIMNKLKPHIILLDLSLQNKNSLQIVKLIRQQLPETTTIIINLIPLQSDALEYVQAGVSGFILKEAKETEFIKTIRMVYSGIKVLPPLLTGALFSQIMGQTNGGLQSSEAAASVRLTKQEMKVIELIAEGATNKEIAQNLRLSIYTVKSHVHNILEKLALQTRVQIAKYIHLSGTNKS